jgi:hypothetical protein
MQYSQELKNFEGFERAVSIAFANLRSNYSERNILIGFAKAALTI